MPATRATGMAIKVGTMRFSEFMPSKFPGHAGIRRDPKQGYAGSPWRSL